MDWLNELHNRLIVRAAILKYSPVTESLIELPVPDIIEIGKRSFPVPGTLEDFSSNLSYAQRLFLATSEQFDVDLVIRIISGYYYPFYSGLKFDENKLLSIQSKIITLPVKVLYPVTHHILNLMGELVDREQKLLYREPSKQEKAAGIEKLSKYSTLTSLLFLMESFRMTESEVMQQPYDDCLVRFMLAKEQNEFSERLTEQYRDKK